MWFLFGSCAIITGILSLSFSFLGKESKWFRFSSLSLTALTVCDFYADAARRVLVRDWSGLEDIVPAVSRGLWICVVASILINGISLFYRKKD